MSICTLHNGPSELTSGPATLSVFTPQLQVLATRAPRTGVPFLEAFKVHYGPPGLLGRFFLSADTRLKERGITLQFITMEELVVLSRDNADNWGSVNVMFDPYQALISPGSMCLVGIDQKGVIRTCVCAKPFDAISQSLASIINNGGLLSLKSNHSAEGLRTRTDAPFALEKRGLIGYCGVVWVHPEARGARFASIMANLMFACILTLWNPSYIIGTVNTSTKGTALHHRYNLPHAEESITVSKNGVPLVELVLLWTSALEATEALSRYLDQIWPEIDAAVVARSRQQTA